MYVANYLAENNGKDERVSFVINYMYMFCTCIYSYVHSSYTYAFLYISFFGTGFTQSLMTLYINVI